MSHKESAQYNQVVLQVLRKALQIIKNYTINSLTFATNSIIQSMQDSPNPVKFSAENSYTMFYSKFRVNSSRIKTLMEQLEQRVEFNNQPDYEYALSECHKWYIQQRRVFISASVTSAINELVQRHQRDTCALVIFIYLKFKLKFNLCFLKVRSSCSFMIHLCQDENQLFNNFFSRASIFFE